MKYASCLLACAYALTGCNEETAMIVFVDSDMNLDEVRVTVTGSDGVRIDPPSIASDFQNQTRPVRLTLVPDDTHAIGASFAIEVTGYTAGVPRIERRAVTTFTEGERLFIKLYLFAVCEDVMCADGRTCTAEQGDAAGVCEDETVRGQEYDGDPLPITTPLVPDGGIGDGSTGSCDPATCWEGCPTAGSPCDPVVQLSAGGAHTCARTEAGDVYCWGANHVGQLGIGTESATNTGEPAMLVELSGPAIDVSAALDHTCAIVAPAGGAREVWCWGDNADGQLGNSSVVGVAPSPVQATVTPGSGEIRDLAAGGQHTCLLVVRTDPERGIIHCTGNNDFGQLASTSSGATVFETTSQKWLGATRIVAGDLHNCNIEYEDGPLACWGDNGSAQLGSGASGPPEPSPDRVLTAAPDTILDDIDDAAAGLAHTCALDADSGEVRCVGSGDHGELGVIDSGGDPVLGERAFASDPVGVSSGPPMRGFTAIAAGVLQTCGIRDGAIWCWGWADSGALGLGDAPNERPPEELPLGQIPAGAEATLIDLGGGDDPETGGSGTESVTHGCALVDGLVYCWGDNVQGQVEVGAGALVTAPRRVPIPLR